MFAAAEVATVAFSGEQGAKSCAGVLLALWALGSMLAGLVTGTLALASGPAVFRVQVGQRRRWPLVMLPIALRRLDGRDGRWPSSSPASRSRRR